jgi:hypothetical protein
MIIKPKPTNASGRRPTETMMMKKRGGSATIGQQKEKKNNGTVVPQFSTMNQVHMNEYEQFGIYLYPHIS